MPAPNKLNPQCPDCGKRTKRKRQNQDGTQIYICSHCGWSNSVKRIPRSLLKRKELYMITIKAAIEFYSQDTYRGSYIDLAAVIGGDRWLYSCDQLVKDLKEIVEKKS
jgi:transposase-like protein